MKRCSCRPWPAVCPPACRCVTRVLLCVLFVGPAALVGDAAELMAKNGMTLQGQLGYLSSIAENPLAPDVPAGGVDVKQVVLLDDGLRRTYLSWHQIQDGSLREDAATPERIKIRQNVATGTRRVGSATAILEMSPFDAWGRRTVSLLTPRGRVDMVQGITEITPLYTRVEGLAGSSAVQWDARIATSSLPRETLSRLLRSQSSAEQPDARLKIVRLLFASERYNEARIELEQAMRQFPELAELQDLLTQLRQYVAQKLIEEIRLRQAAGQHQQVQAFLANFPDEGASTETLLQVSQLQREYQEGAQQIQTLQQSAKRLAAAWSDPQGREQAAVICDEIERELNMNSLGRLVDFQRLADDPNLPDQNKLALVLSGWIVGAGSASQNVSEALSLVRVRDLVTQYLQAGQPGQLPETLQRLGQEEAGTPQRVAQILEQMKPPQDTPAQPDRPPGNFRLQARSLDPEGTLEYEIQLPDQYDPYRRYPVIISLHSSGRTPAEQIDWWAGAYAAEQQIRLGQASRHGYVVMAPAWLRERQTRYEYSAREHAAVLSCLRDACRRFSLDTDRVFLSGHGIGGDAAWDIGLSHPDLWAGVIPIVAVADYGPKDPKYISLYWENARYVPLYFVAGELDGDKMTRNGRDFDRYMTRPNYDVLVVEYIGRGQEHFYDEIHRLFTWMGLHRRNLDLTEFSCNSMRPFDNFFWCLEVDQLPARSQVLPLAWPAPPGARPAVTECRKYVDNRLAIKTGAAQATLWLTPQWVDWSRPLEVSVNGKTRSHRVGPSLETLLEDARTRADRRHPFWAALPLETGNRSARIARGNHATCAGGRRWTP